MSTGVMNISVERGMASYQINFVKIRISNKKQKRDIFVERYTIEGLKS